MADIIEDRVDSAKLAEFSSFPSVLGGNAYESKIEFSCSTTLGDRR